MKVAKQHDITITVLTNIADVDAEELAITGLYDTLGISDKGVSVSPKHDVKPGHLGRYVGFYESGEGQKVNMT
ncbi:hypothetical protein ACFQ3N_15550 [Virgibacillus byunsanensis]|uniref:Uncharacterized protein n=2 Tax=Virgibacillus byunsanensis TaxID=570945 RepID=A0ABW3LN33_9BACI